MDKLNILLGQSGLANLTLGQLTMIIVGLLLLYLAINKRFEPLLLLPIGFGAILVNIPGAGMYAEPIYAADGHLEAAGGLLYYVYSVGIESGVFPLLIFMGVGAMTDFGPMLANPKTLFLGAAAQFGIFGTIIGAVWMSSMGWMDFSLADAAAIGIIGGADGPTSIFVASRLAPDLLGAIAVA
ncbi:MAG: sodium ion-translocating decarboxylase subunit beta, partial [Saccharospirillum sp.]